MPWLLLALVAAGGLVWWERRKSASPSPTPTPPGPGPGPGPTPTPTPPGPAPSGTVTTSSDGQGNAIVTVAPGDMGTLSMQSAASAAAALVTPYGLGISAPSSGGITAISSTNPAVVAPPSIMDPSNLGQPVSLKILGPALTPGNATIGVFWIDGSGTPQTSSISLIAT